MYTPPTVIIKRAYVFDQVQEAKVLGIYNESTAQTAEEEFDRWFKSENARVFREGQESFGDPTKPYEE